MRLIPLQHLLLSRGAFTISEEVIKRNLNIAVVGIPKVRHIPIPVPILLRFNSYRARSCEHFNAHCLFESRLPSPSQYSLTV